jgi:hypothetical protein
MHELLCAAAAALWCCVCCVLLCAAACAACCVLRAGLCSTAIYCSVLLYELSTALQLCSGYVRIDKKVMFTCSLLLILLSIAVLPLDIASSDTVAVGWHCAVVALKKTRIWCSCLALLQE